MEKIRCNKVKWEETPICSNYVIKPKEHYDIDVYTKNHKDVCLCISFNYNVGINISIDCHDGFNGNLLELGKIAKDVKIESATDYCWIFDTSGCEHFKFRIKNDDKSSSVFLGKVMKGFVKKDM